MQQKSIADYQNFKWEKTCEVTMYDRLRTIIFFDDWLL